MDGSGILYGATRNKRYNIQPDQVVRRNDEAISEARQDLTKNFFQNIQ
jgi:hypothetical protein